MTQESKRWIAVAVVTVAVICGALAAPAGLRRIDAFRIHRVVVTGAHFMTPQQVLEASRITRSASVFDDATQWRDALLKHPLVATASVQRRLPNTTLIAITETQPVAFARTPELRPIDGAGQVLPADPSRVDMDLPIIDAAARPDAAGQVRDSGIVRTARVLQRLQILEPVLSPWVSEALPLRDGVQLLLRGPATAQVLLPFDIDAKRLRELRVTLADLAATGLDQVLRIDARYREQVVVSLQQTGAH
jgi:cell division protein FtsQ